jgi:hypothetical protein
LPNHYLNKPLLKGRKFLDESALGEVMIEAMTTGKDETLSRLLAQEARTRSAAYLAYQEAISSKNAEHRLWEAMDRHRAAVQAVMDHQKDRCTYRS